MNELLVIEWGSQLRRLSDAQAQMLPMGKVRRTTVRPTSGPDDEDPRLRGLILAAASIARDHRLMLLRCLVKSNNFGSKPAHNCVAGRGQYASRGYRLFVRGLCCACCGRERLNGGNEKGRSHDTIRLPVWRVLRSPFPLKEMARAEATRALTVVLLLLCLSLGNSAGHAALAAKDHAKDHVHVYLIRGVLNIFSLGLDEIASKLQRKASRRACITI